MSTEDKFKIVERMLYNYKNTGAEIKILKRNLEILENDYRGVGSICYEERSSPTNAFSSSVENEVIRRSQEIQKLRNEIRLKEIEIENINDAIVVLNEDEKYIVNERYFNHKRNKDIAIHLNVTEDTASRYKNSIVNKLMPLLSK